MKKLSFLTMALFLFFGISCQKQEIEIPKEESQNVIYSFNIDEDEESFAAALSSKCSCSLNVSANRNNTQGTPFDDWRAWVKFSDGTFPARFGASDIAYVGSDSSTSFADENGDIQSISFLPPTNSFDLVIAFPSSADWDPGVVSASVTCRYANHSGGVGFTYTGSAFSPISAPRSGAISSCSVYPLVSG